MPYAAETEAVYMTRFCVIKGRTVLVGVLCVAFVSIGWGAVRATESPGAPPVFAAAGTVLRCASWSSAERLDCYAQELSAKYPKFTIDDIFGMLAHIQRIDHAAHRCHVIAHEIAGVALYDDPSRWKDLLWEGAEGMCGYGFQHGLQIAAFRQIRLPNGTIEDAQSLFSDACTDTGTASVRRDLSACFHGLGHIFYYITAQNIAEASLLCDAIVPEGPEFPYAVMKSQCFDGVFMSLFFDQEPEDVLEEKPFQVTVENAPGYCMSFEDDRWRGACLRSIRYLVLDRLRFAEDVERVCAMQPNETEVDICYAAFQKTTTYEHIDNPRFATEPCRRISPERQEGCYATTAINFLHHGGARAVRRATAACAYAPREHQPLCFEAIAYAAAWYAPSESKARAQFCDSIPRNFRSACLGGT